MTRFNRGLPTHDLFRFMTLMGCLLSVGANGKPAQAQTYDLSAMFSFAANPNGVWQYGYSATSSLDPAQFRLDTFADTSNPIGFWHPDSTTGYYPYVAQNTTGSSRTDPTNAWAVRGGEVAMEASNSGQYSLIRFVTPQAGTYRVTAMFEGIHFRLSSTDVHVLQNTASVFDANIDGYGGDPAFHAVQGANPNAAYSGDLNLQAGDILTFAVGYGPNQTNYNDTTGLFARVQAVPEPGLISSFLLAGLSLSGLAIRDRRKTFCRV